MVARSSAPAVSRGARRIQLHLVSGKSQAVGSLQWYAVSGISSSRPRRNCHQRCVTAEGLSFPAICCMLRNTVTGRSQRSVTGSTWLMHYYVRYIALIYVLPADIVHVVQRCSRVELNINKELHLMDVLSYQRVSHVLRNAETEWN